MGNMPWAPELPGMDRSFSPGQLSPEWESLHPCTLAGHLLSTAHHRHAREPEMRQWWSRVGRISGPWKVLE